MELLNTLKIWHRSLSLTWLASLCAVQPCFALASASTSNEYLLNLSIQELMDIKISGSTLTDESILTVPSSVTVFTQADIRQLGVNRLTQLANFVPGFQSYRSDESGVQEMVSNRGRRLGAAGREMLVLLDGTRLNNDYNGGAFANIPYITLANVERVEFIRGPGSAIHGANAALAVINIITQKKGREMTLAVSSPEGYRTSVQTDIEMNEGEMSVFAESIGFRGFSPTLYDAIDKQYETSRDPYSVQTLSYHFSSHGFSGNFNFNQFNSPDFYVIGAANTEENKYYGEGYRVELKHRAEFSQHLQQEVMMYYHQHSAYAQSIAIPSEKAVLLPNTAAFIIGGGAKHTESGVNWTISNNQHNQWHWLVGAELRQPKIVYSTGYSNYSTEDYVNILTLGRPMRYYGQFVADVENIAPQQRNIHSAFAQLQFYPSKQWDFVLAGRVDDFSDVGSHFSPRMASIYHYNDNNALKLMYGEAFRPAAMLELHTKNNVAFASNPDLQPEITKTTELTWEHIANTSQLSTTLYHVTIEDAYYRVNVPGTLKRKWLNGSSLSTNGIEIEGRYALSEAWSMRGTASYVYDPVIDINSEARHLASVTINYAKDAWHNSLSTVYHGERQDDYSTSPFSVFTGQNTHGGYALLSGRTSYNLKKNLTLFARGENLLNKKYIVPAEQALGNLVGVPGRGRYLEVGVTWDFGK